MYFNRYERQSWRDTMQVCVNGHVINAGSQKYPEYNKDFCTQCGAKTITQCQKCSSPIPGDLQDTGVAVIGFHAPAPEFCQHCGEKFPWTNKESKKVQNKPGAIEDIQNLLMRFHRIARALRKRHDNRGTLDITDEYDVQDLLNALLQIHFDDIRTEEWTPSYAGKCSRADFVLKEQEVVVEVKMTRKGLGDKELGDQLIIDIERYKTHQNCKTLVCFVYDPEGRVANPNGLAKDLESQSRNGLRVVVFINPT
jgi:predicted RNA-binding Zn-ribbon protein involved in translation (DUF1610 family)